MNNLEALGWMGEKIKKRLTEEEFVRVKADLYMRKNRQGDKHFIDYRNGQCVAYAYNKEGDSLTVTSLNRLKRELRIIGDPHQKKLMEEEE